MNPFKTVLGTNHKVARSRVWIEGNRLVEAGFKVGARYHRTTSGVTGDGITLRLAPDGKYKVSGKGEKPIIDITGEAVRKTFPTGDTVDVIYSPGVIVIRQD